MKKKLIIIVFLVSTIFQYNCTSIRQVTNDYELRDINKLHKIYVFTKDSILYELNKYNLLGDSVLTGFGYKIISESEEPFEGRIILKNIKYVLTSERDFWKSALAVGIISYIGITGISYLGKDNDLRMWSVVKYPYSTGTGSCPFIYSWNGDEYILEGEAFGIGLSKSFEMKTSHVLNFLSPFNSFCKIKLSNERPETHYFNQVEVKAFEVDKNIEVYSDVNNQFWQVEKTIIPSKANDYLGSNIIQKISNKDSDYWESDLSNIKSSSNFEDVIEVEFIKEKSVNDGVLLIHAINTNLSQKVFEFLGSYLGDQILEFYNSLETDPEMISVFRDWVKEISLKAFIWNRDKWEELGFIYPEANSISFSKVIPLHFENINQDTIRIMLKALTDVWKIDAVQIGTSSKLVQKIKDIPLITKEGDYQNDVIELLKNSDSKYKVLFPSESIELSFNPIIPTKGKKIVYALNVHGYLYEWMPENSVLSDFQFINVNRTNKITYLKNLLKYKSVFLPPIYSEWKKEKEK